MKTCSKCRKVKPPDQFSKDLSRKDGLSHCCNLCCSVAKKKQWSRLTPEERTQRQRRRDYRMESEDFDQIRLNQQNRCAICHLEFLKTPDIDHNHATGKVRGLLCRSCNSGLGAFFDSPNRLIAAANYLDKANPLK